MDEILMNLAIEAPSSAVAIYALWRMSLVMIKLSEALTAISNQNAASITEMVEKENVKQTVLPRLEIQS